MEPRELDLESLRAFGAAADVPDGPNIEMEKGGFIIPGSRPVPNSNPGKKGTYHHGTQQLAGLAARRGSGLRKRAARRSATRGSSGETHRAAGKARGTGEARSTLGESLPATTEAEPTEVATGPAPQTLGRRLSALLGLEELEHWYPSSRIVRRSSSLALMSVDVGVIRSLPYRGRLLLEIPLDDPRGLIPPPDPTTNAFVPIVRVWTYWNDGTCPRVIMSTPTGAYAPTCRTSGSGDAIPCMSWLTGAPAGSRRPYISSS